MEGCLTYVHRATEMIHHLADPLGHRLDVRADDRLHVQLARFELLHSRLELFDLALEFRSCGVSVSFHLRSLFLQ